LAACAEPDVSAHVEVSVAALRPDSPNTDALPPVFTASEKVERFDSAGGSFRVHYSRSGRNAVPPADTDTDGIPDYVQLVAAEYDAVGDYYATQLGFERPPSDSSVSGDNGGDGRFDVYLVDFSTTSDGSFVAESCAAPGALRCPGYMKHENDFTGRNYASLARASRILASHEYFHAIQAGYDAKAGPNVDEGTAVWGSEAYDSSLDDLEGFVSGYLDRVDRSLTQEPTGPVDAFSYGSSLFFQFLGERFGREIIRELWETLRDHAQTDGPDATWVPALDAALKAKHDSSIADAFAEFSRWNLYTATRADPEKAYASGRNYPELKTKSVTLPLEDTGPRIFPVSAKFYSVRVRDAGAVRLALRATTATTFDGLRLLLAREAGGRIADVVEANATNTSSIELGAVESGDTVYAAVLNTRFEGESLRPDVCFGSAADLKECAGKGGAADAGNADASDREPAAKSDSGCSVVAPGVQRSGALALLVSAFVASLRSRRWRRATMRR
jgi:hypothetical protein